MEKIKFPHNVGLCRWCTWKESIKQRLGLKHPMLPNKVWHGEYPWKWHCGYGVLNKNWKLRVVKGGDDGTKMDY